MRALRRHDAAEMVRTRQQGYGKPIITAELADHRLVFVANRVFWSKDWVFFTDFLLRFLRDILGNSWGQAEIARGSTHPVIRWMKRAHEAAQEGESGKRVLLPEAGYLSSLFRLANALYLIAHHDEIPSNLVSRLRRSQDDIFRPAVYETLVAAAFAVAGFKIEGAESVRSSLRKPEFRATGPSGKVYSVEAKCKLGWKSPFDLESEAFRAELRAWLRDKLHAASNKRLPSPVYWFELSLPIAFSQAQAEAMSKLIAEIIEGAADITVGGEPAAPAHVVITNRAHLVVEEDPPGASMAMMTGFRLPDYAVRGHAPLEMLFDIRDRNREITRPFECLQEIDQIPHAFDGQADELTDEQGQVVPTMRVDEPISIDFPDGTSITGTLRQVLPMGKEAWVVVQSEDGQHQLATMPLTEAEAIAAARHGPSVFGEPKGPHKDHGGDPIGLYDAMLETYRDYDRAGLLRQIQTHPRYAEFEHLAVSDLRIRVAREITTTMHRSSQSQR